jgi:hypothetical protein
MFKTMLAVALCALVIMLVVELRGRAGTCEVEDDLHYVTGRFAMDSFPQGCQR